MQLIMGDIFFFSVEVMEANFDEWNVFYKDKSKISWKWSMKPRKIKNSVPYNHESKIGN